MEKSSALLKNNSSNTSRGYTLTKKSEVPLILLQNLILPSSKKTLILVASGSIPHFSFLIRVHIFPLISHFPLFKLQRENGSFTAACLSARETFMSVEAHKILNWIFASKHISILDMCCTTAVCWDYAKPIFISLQKFPSKRNIKTWAELVNEIYYLFIFHFSQQWLLL